MASPSNTLTIQASTGDGPTRFPLYKTSKQMWKELILHGMPAGQQLEKAPGSTLTSMVFDKKHVKD